MNIANSRSCGGQDLLAKPVVGSPNRVAAHSHRHEPIDTSKDYYGNSRAWGDASHLVQKKVVAEILSKTKQYSLQERATALAIIRFESGFNPDAAAPSTSASGLAQFIDKTGSSYGLDSSNRFSMEQSITAFLSHIADLRTLISKKFPGGQNDTALLYGLYHDGPSLKYGGYKLGQQKVIPLQKKFLSWLTCVERKSSSSENESLLVSGREFPLP